MNKFTVSSSAQAKASNSPEKESKLSLCCAVFVIQHIKKLH